MNIISCIICGHKEANWKEMAWHIHRDHMDGEGGSGANSYRVCLCGKKFKNPCARLGTIALGEHLKGLSKKQWERHKMAFLFHKSFS